MNEVNQDKNQVKSDCTSIKVLHLIDSGGLYGAEVMLLNLVKSQVALGLKPMILSVGDLGVGEKPLEKAAIEQGLKVKAIRFKSGLNVRASISLLSFAKSQGYDVIHSHGYKFNILLGLWPKVFRKIPFISTLHGYVNAKKYSKMWINEVLDRFFIKRADLVVLVNRVMLENPVIKSIQLSNYVVIDNGIDVSSKPDDAVVSNTFKNFMAGHDKILGYVGRLSPEKGIKVLLNALKIVNNDHLVGVVIIGSGSQYDELNEMTSLLALERNILFLGYIDNPVSYMKQFDALIMPSFTEGLPITLLEAMNAKVPVIASSVGGIPDVLNESSCGYLVKSGNVEALANSITFLIDTPLDAEAKVNRAYRRVCDSYSSEKMAKEYENAYQQCILKYV